MQLDRIQMAVHDELHLINPAISVIIYICYVILSAIIFVHI